MLVYIALMLTVIISCQVKQTKSDSSDINIISVNPVHITEDISDPALQMACQYWNLSAEQVKQFFLLSDKMDTNPYQAFYQLPCSINGKLKADNQL